MNGSQSRESSPASSKHAQNLEELRQRISQDENIASQLRAGGEPGLLGASGVDDQTLLRWLKAEKCVSLGTPLLSLLRTIIIHRMKAVMCVSYVCKFSGTASVKQSRG